MPRKEAAPQTTNENTPSNEAPRLKIAERYQRESSVDQSPAENPVDTTVEDATSRLETIEGRGSEIRTKIKETLRSVGRSVGNFIVRNGDRALGATVVGAEKARDYTKSATEYAGDLKDAASQRYAQRVERRERREFAAQREISDQFNSAKTDEAELLSGVQAGDAETFNYMPEGTEAEQAGRRAAKQEAVDAAHEEAIERNAQYDTAYESQKEWIKAADERKDPEYLTVLKGFNSEQRSAAERANREALESAHLEALDIDESWEETYDTEYDKAEAFLARFKDNKDAQLTNILREFRTAFPSQENSHQWAYNDAFDAFAGNRLKSAAKAKRIKDVRAKATEFRRATYEASRDKASETYQRANGARKTIGRAIARFTGRTASAVKSGFSAFHTSWQETKAVAETEPQTNE